MPRVVVRPRARQDLREIAIYVAERNPVAARRLVARIVASCKLHASVPRGGRARPELGQHLRSFVVDPYIVVYLPIDDGIDVVRVVHGRRNIPAVVKPG